MSLPVQPLGILVDEAFGLDFELLRVGARSAIGSLYEVPGLPTAVILDRYRHRLVEGAPAPMALADAQRYWINEALPELVEKLRASPAGGLAAFARARGIEPPSSVGVDLDVLVCPLAWAAFRFVGVAERRPLDAWDAAWDAPLTAAQEAEVAALVDAELARMRRAAPRGPVRMRSAIRPGRDLRLRAAARMQRGVRIHAPG